MNLACCLCMFLDAESVDHSSKTLLRMAQQLQRLVSFYQFIRREHQIPPTYSTVVADNLNSPQVGPRTSSNCCHPTACEDCLSSCREVLALFRSLCFSYSWKSQLCLHHCCICIVSIKITRIHNVVYRITRGILSSSVLWSQKSYNYL